LAASPWIRVAERATTLLSLLSVDAMWALLSGLRGNLKAYEAVLKRIFGVSRVSTTVQILGDCGP